MQVIKNIADWFLRTAAILGPWGLFLVALADSALVPLPQGVDALIVAQAIAAPGSTYFAAGLAVAGSLLGSLILYGMAARGGKLMLEKKISAAGIEKMHRQMEKYGALVLLLPTMIPLPLPMKLIVIGAGVFQMKLPRFIAVITLARIVRYFGIAYLALRYGETATRLIQENAGIGVAVAAAIIALFFFVNRWSARRVSEG